MSSVKESSSDEDDPTNLDVDGVSPPKRHKKHKHKKHKRRRDVGLTKGPTSASCPVTGQVDTDLDTGKSAPLKLKFKIAGQSSSGEKRHLFPPKTEIQDCGTDEENVHVEVVDDVPGTLGVSVDSDISDEDAWLEALESGKLDEYDAEMRRMKDPTLMTARQRALLESKMQRDTPIGEYLCLPSGYKEKEMTEEMLQKRELRAKKRRQQAKEKREKDKKQTIDRLLKKQDSKPKGSKVSKAAKKAEVPKTTYINGQTRILLSLPTGCELPLPKPGPIPPERKMCQVPGCKSPKRYSCSKTGVALCSLECYKKNLTLNRCV